MHAYCNKLKYINVANIISEDEASKFDFCKSIDVLDEDFIDFDYPIIFGHNVVVYDGIMHQIYVLIEFYRNEKFRSTDKEVITKLLETRLSIQCKNMVANLVCVDLYLIDYRRFKLFMKDFKRNTKYIEENFERDDLFDRRNILMYNNILVKYYGKVIKKLLINEMNKFLPKHLRV